MLTARNFPILQCGKCSLVFTGINKDFDSSQIYGEQFWHAKERDIGYSDYFKDSDSTLRQCKRRIEKIDRLRKGRTGTALDFGCGPGFFLKTARDYGWEPYGIDISQYAIDYGKKELALPYLHCGTELTESWNDLRFDLITLWAVIEHLPDPWSVVKDLAGRLKPDGMLCMTTGNWDSIASRREREKWRLMTPPGHLYFFTRRTIVELLRRCSLHMIHYRTNDYFGSSPSFLLNIKPIRKILRTLGYGDIMMVYAVPSKY
jgi:2-polyprenyl-3-methyl-5-hydroxy-6-metoxy-1,4-benzoquinol methylase